MCIFVALKKSTICKLLLVMAAAILYLVQPLDMAGHFASEAVAAGSTSTLVRVASSFDVIDDALDHIPSNKSTGDAHQHHFQFDLRLDERFLAILAISALSVRISYLEPFLRQAPSGALLRPPRA